MAKSDKSLEEIDLSRAYTPPRSVAWAKEKPVNGFDTETMDGSIFALSLAWDGKEGRVGHSNGKALSPSQIWDILTHTNARSSLNMWYNLDFDANVLLNQVLDKESLAELTVSGYTEASAYEITYIRTKFLEIKDRNKNVYTHYDASQFFFTSLENAVAEWLGKTKADDNLEASLFGTNTSKQLRKVVKESDNISWNDLPVSPGESWNISHAKNYIQNNWKRIIRYAKIDAELVRDLWKKAIQVGEKLEIPMGRPFSTGYLAESYLDAHLHNKPGMGPREMAKLAWDSYAGGRFEVIKRGNIGPVCGPDINSAYPANLSNLPDPKTLTWKNSTNASIQEIKEADYGFIKAKVTTDATRPIQPFAIKDESQDKLVYPALQNKEISAVKEIFTNAYDNNYLINYDIQNAWLGYETEGTKFPFTFIDSLYNDRQKAKAKGQNQRELWLKIVLNSMYGKTCQTTPKREAVTGKTTIQENENYVPDLSLPKMIRNNYSEGFIERLEAGSWFNPFLASYITGLTRLELHKQILNYELEHNTVMLATDCLMVEAEAFENSNFQEDLVKEGLGYWDMEYEGNAFVLGAGVYQINFPDTNKKPKIKTRGFEEADLQKGLLNEAQKANGKIHIESLRPKSVAEVIWSNDELGNVGNFLSHERQIKPDMDTKRNWQKEATFQNLLKSAHTSKPLLISE